MVRPPEAEPVSAARILVATASDTSGPPSMPSTQAFTASKAGSDATTAPKPTRLATLMIGSTAALAPASIVSRKVGRRLKLVATSTAIATASATMTDQTPPTAASVVEPHCGSARKVASILGRTRNDMIKLTNTTVTSGSAASANDGGAGACAPLALSPGSNSRAVVARSRTISSAAAGAGSVGSV